MRTAALLLTVTLFGLPLSDAFACPTLKPWRERRVQERLDEHLMSADRVVEGRWVALETITEEDHEVTTGRIEFRRNGKDASIEANAVNLWIMCSPVSDPGDGDVGVFYLERFGPGFVIMHFEPKARRRMPARP